VLVRHIASVAGVNGVMRDVTTGEDTRWLERRFEEQRPRLRALAFRMLGSLGDAEDAVQESWVRLSRGDRGDVENLPAWLTTVVARVCLNTLRSRDARREVALDELPEPVAPDAGPDPEQEAVLADSVGLALLVVLDTLGPAERLAFVLHDLFAVPFEEIAPIVGRSPAATRQLASRARRRLRGADAAGNVDAREQRRVVEAFLAASRDGDFAALLALLDADVTLRVDGAAAGSGVPEVLHGARTVAQRACAYPQRARHTRVALVDGAAGLVVAPRGRLLLVLTLQVTDGRVTGMEVIADRDRLARIDLGLLDPLPPAAM
jgi:RNA polymerase sigma-70 factor, ECF subfamily